MVIVFFVTFYNVSRIPSQIQHHSLGGRKNLIEPHNPHIENLQHNFSEWHLQKYNQSFSSVEESTREELNQKLQRVHHYIYDYRMEYTPDSEAPYHTSDYIATIDEIFQSDTDGDGKLQDDCDGITLVTVSLLIHLGYDAFIAECIGHWNTIVFPEGVNPETEAGFEKGIHLYNSWGRPTFYMFNQSRIIIPPGRPVYKSVAEVFFDERTYTYDYLDFFRGQYLDLPLYLLIVVAYILILVAAAITFYVVKFGIEKKERIRKLKCRWFFSKNSGKSIFYGSLIGSYFAFIIFWFTVSGFGFLGTSLLALAFIILMRYFEFSIKKKSITKKKKT
ncbi:MAG: hypothetical protein R6U96_16735 [Promethearchaeia archaeon]